MLDYNIENILKVIFDDSESPEWSPSDKISLVTKEIEKYKLDINEYLSGSEYNIQDIMFESRRLSIESLHMIEEMTKCKDLIETRTMTEILAAIVSQDSITNELEIVNFSINILYDVVQCSKYLKEFEECKQNDKYLRASEAITDMMMFLDNPVEGFKEINMYTNFKAISEKCWDEFWELIQKRWDQYISWTLSEDDQFNTISINIFFKDDHSSSDLINGLKLCKKLDEKVNEFANFLLDEILIPIIQQNCTVFLEAEEKMTIIVPSKTDQEQIKPTYDVVISNLRILLNFLASLLNIAYFNNNITIMSMVGKEINKKFAEVLIKDCLIDTIPNNIDDLQIYDVITSEIEDFQRFLVTTKLFPNNDISILTYTDNIDVLFADRSSQYFLEAARTIMLKDLSSSMSIGVESLPEDEPEALVLDAPTEEALKAFDKVLPQSLFFFPRCMMSKSTQELLDLIYSMMEQAVLCSDYVSEKLYATTRLVFELYDAVVPYHHENYLQTIPQYVALFHNNCMYLAHNLLTLGDKWMNLMSEREVKYPISFLDLVQKLRDLGYKHLTDHMQQQRKQILDNIRSSDLNSLMVKDVLSENAEQAVRQCLRQLQLLKNVWIGVFPHNVFTRLMATLVNMFLEELIHRVCTVEDISVEMATQLTEIYTIVVKKARNNFQNVADLEEHVKSWVKFQELILVLGGSLRDIDNRWNDGKGPLATHFTSIEIRNLIKALFQNTQIRANLLSKIK